jgi:hypothetical protein
VTRSRARVALMIRSHPPPHAGCPRGDPGPLPVLTLSPASQAPIFDGGFDPEAYAPGRGLQPSISTGVLDFMLASAPRTFIIFYFCRPNFLAPKVRPCFHRDP